MKIEIESWVIVSNDGKYIATGVPRNRSLTKVADYKGERILTYRSEKRAIAGFRDSGFLGSPWPWNTDLTKHLQAKKAKISIEV